MKDLIPEFQFRQYLSIGTDIIYEIHSFLLNFVNSNLRYF
jgi:hypothetical protein